MQGKTPSELAWIVLGWILSCIALTWFFCEMSGCYRGVMSEEDAAKQNLCISEWLRIASEAPSCKESLSHLSEFVKSDPGCLTILGRPDTGHGLLTIVCSDTEARR